MKHTTVDDVLRSSDLSPDAKLLALWLLTRAHKRYHRDDVVKALALRHGDYERAVLSLQRDGICAGKDVSYVEMPADHPLRPAKPAPRRAKESEE